MPPDATLGRESPAPHMGSTIELTPLMEVWVRQPELVSMGELFPLLMCRVVAEMMESFSPTLFFPSPCSLMPQAGRRADTEVLSVLWS